MFHESSNLFLFSFFFFCVCACRCPGSIRFLSHFLSGVESCVMCSKMGADISMEERAIENPHRARSFSYLIPETMMQESENSETSGDLNVSFGYQCSSYQSILPKGNCTFEISSSFQAEESTIKLRSSSFSCLSGAALSANFTLANTNICNGVIGEEILPGLDSPQSFRRIPSSPSFPRLDLISSSSLNSLSASGRSSSSDTEETSNSILRSMSAPTRVQSSSFLNAMDVQMAGGAAGEDRVQAVCSEENGWLFCGVYDGFNGRDAADFLAGTLYENIGYYIYCLECNAKQQTDCNVSLKDNYPQCPCDCTVISSSSDHENKHEQSMSTKSSYEDHSPESFRKGVLDCLVRALAQAENDFMFMVEREMEDRPDLVSVGSSVLTVLLHGIDLYVMNLGDSRAVLATSPGNGPVQAIQLTETHNVDNKAEYQKVLADHPDDPSSIIGGRVKGKLQLTRAFGVGYLKKRKLNNALMGILRVRDLRSPPYVYTDPFVTSHRVSEDDLFVVVGSDGLFDFFTNDEVVQTVQQFIHDNPFEDPAKYLIEQLIIRAAQNAGLSTEELLRIPAGRRRKYHDDVTVMVIVLGNKQRTSKASTTS